MAVNGCSCGVSWLWRVFTGAPPSFEYCCDEHDLFYDQGGSGADRLFADRLFLACMLADLQTRGKGPALGRLFYRGVRAFGWINWAWCAVLRRAGAFKE